MAKLEWDGDAARVYELLDYDHGGSVTLEEIDEKAAAAMARGDDELGLDVEVEKKDFRALTFEERSMTEAQRRNAALGKMQREKIAEEQKAKQAADIGSYTFA